MKHITFSILSFAFLMAAAAQTQSQFIVSDQFGYLPDAPKIAVIRDPQLGFDSYQSFTPGNTYAVVNASTLDTILKGSPVVWNNGSTDASSGDKVWWFDFSEVNATGLYFIVDVEKNVKTWDFIISPSVYNEILKHAVRAFFYQRAGFAKQEPFAEKGWVDAESHMRNLQDKNARIYNDAGNAETEKDVSGGWYDAGDYNKYTSWTANYVTDMMLAYLEKPEVWTDDYNLPESGNGIPDLLDEAKWGTDHLLRLQQEDGSVLSIVGMAHASPPSAATGPSKYGPPNTSATLNTAAALAISSKAFKAMGMDEYADTLQKYAIKAWEWADANPDSLFQNNDAAYGSSGLGAGQMETDNYGRTTAKLKAACFLFDITSDETYKDHFDNNYNQVNMFAWNFAFPFQGANQDMLLYYTSIENANPTVVAHIKQVYGNAMTNGSENFPAINNKKDPYMAHIKDYTWGSNAVKCIQGGMYYNMLQYQVKDGLDEKAKNAAIGYINYMHGVNPLNMVYLSNMYKYGAKNGVNEFYHTWFVNKSAKWDRAGVSQYGPAPGFLTGGPNPSYNWDNCCPSNCGSAANNAICVAESISPPKDQPNQKSYKDFNTSWPLNSWSVTENSNGYQIAYIRLLSKFVYPEYDCNGELNGTASIDVCGVCADGNTGIVPETNPDNCVIPYLNVSEINNSPFIIYPNPVINTLMIESGTDRPYQMILQDIHGKVIQNTVQTGNGKVELEELPMGMYLVTLINDYGFYTHKILKK